MAIPLAALGRIATSGVGKSLLGGNIEVCPKTKVGKLLGGFSGRNKNCIPRDQYKKMQAEKARQTTVTKAYTGSPQTSTTMAQPKVSGGLTFGKQQNQPLLLIAGAVLVTFLITRMFVPQKRRRR